MEKALQITFRGMEPSDAVRAKIEEKAARLDKVCDRITGCRVVVEAPHRHHQKGMLFQVRIDLSVPGADIVVNRKPQSKQAHEDVYVALRDAFDAAKGKLEDYMRRRQRKVKSHEEPALGKIIKLLPESDCGFIENREGEEIYFHRNSVLNDGYMKLEVDQVVRYYEEQGEKGAQASTVMIVGGRQKK